MRSGLLKMTLFAAMLMVATGLWAQNSFKVEAPNVVGQGERFLVRFVASGDVSSFNRPTFSGADVIAGPTTSTSSFTSIVNGKRTSS